MIGRRVSLALRRSVDPGTGALLNEGAQHHGYQLFDGAWVHARHSKFVRMALANTTSSLAKSGTDVAKRANQPPPVFTARDELQHPKQAYMRGLLDARLRLRTQPRPKTLRDRTDNTSVQVPAPWRLPSGRLTPPWLAMTQELWAVVAAGRPLDLVLPDNAYMMGAVDGAFRFFEDDVHQAQADEIACARTGSE